MLRPRSRAALPFVVLGVLAILAGGGLSAALASAPSRPVMWLVAYLVLVVGVMQVVLGAGQAALATAPPGRLATWGAWALFNLGNVGVIGGTLAARPGLVLGATLVFILALIAFLAGVRGSPRKGRAWLYRVIVAALLASACIGVFLSLRGHG